jgi:hypothetical protein
MRDRLGLGLRSDIVEYLHVEFMDAIVHRVVDLVEDLCTPWETLWTGARDSHLPKRVEPEVP